MSVTSQPVIHLPEGLPAAGLYHNTLYTAKVPYLLGDTVGADRHWDLSGVVWSEAVHQTDSLIPVGDRPEETAPQGTAMILYRPSGDERSYLRLEGEELIALGHFSPYYDQHVEYRNPDVLWWNGAYLNNYASFPSPELENVKARRAYVAAGELSTPFGHFSDLVLMAVWKDETEGPEHFELVHPDNVLQPIVLFWYTGDLQLFIPAGYDPLPGH